MALLKSNFFAKSERCEWFKDEVELLALLESPPSLLIPFAVSNVHCLLVTLGGCKLGGFWTTPFPSLTVIISWSHQQESSFAAHPPSYLYSSVFCFKPIKEISTFTFTLKLFRLSNKLLPLELHMQSMCFALFPLFMEAVFGGQQNPSCLCSLCILGQQGYNCCNFCYLHLTQLMKWCWRRNRQRYPFRNPWWCLTPCHHYQEGDLSGPLAGDMEFVAKVLILKVADVRASEEEELTKTCELSWDLALKPALRQLQSLPKTR